MSGSESCDKKTCKCRDEPSNFDLYKIALATRNFEIDLSWKRSNYFLVLNTAVAIGFFWFNAQPSDGYFSYNISDEVYKLVIAICGIIISILWANVNFGSKYWQSYWEQRLLEVERGLINADTREEVNFFTTDRGITNKAVSGNLGAIDEYGDTLDSKFKYKRLDKRIIYKYGVLERKPSVSYAMTWLSIFFCFFWNFLLAYTAYCLTDITSAVLIFLAGCFFIVAFLFCKFRTRTFWGLLIAFIIMVVFAICFAIR